MYKVLVVDDEIWICKLIRKIINWDELGFQILADVLDGFTALQFIKQHKPDLVITDIQMPGIDGLNLIKSVRELEIDTEFIIISGYSDFEYARSALTYDAFGYIVKPLDKCSFRDVISSVKEKIDKKFEIRNKLEISETRMLEQELKKMIEHSNPEIKIDDINKQYGTKFEQGSFCVVTLKRDHISREKINPSDSSEYTRFLLQASEKYFHGLYDAVFFVGETDDWAVFLVNLNPDMMDGLKQILRQLTADCGKTFSHLFGITMGLGLPVTEFGDISLSYKSAVNAVKARIVLGTGKLIDAKDEAYRILDLKNVISVREDKKLSMLIDVFDIEGAKAEIANIFGRIDREEETNAIAYHLAAYEMVNILFMSVKRKGIKMTNVLTRESAIAQIDSCSSKTQIESYIYMLLKEYCSAYDEGRMDSGDKLIKEIRSFISENYTSDIGLDDVAKLVCLNPNYVSEIFKKKTGENFSEYLIDYRIEIAKDLLKDIRYKVIDISLMVGYKDSKYFSRLFKKKVGVNPTDYRNLYL